MVECSCFTLETATVGMCMVTVSSTPSTEELVSLSLNYTPANFVYLSVEISNIFYVVMYNTVI
jgi:hypothetical protein